MLPRKNQPVSSRCCHGAGLGMSSRSNRSQRVGEIAAGAFSLGVLALVPKCPLCLAAHVALWTGLGLSLAEATYLRWSLLLSSAAALAYLAIRLAARRRRRVSVGR